jgi:hypothetical protein
LTVSVSEQPEQSVAAFGVRTLDADDAAALHENRADCATIPAYFHARELATDTDDLEYLRQVEIAQAAL